MWRDVSGDRLGYDIESLDPARGQQRFIEAKGREKGARTATVTHTEIRVGYNSHEQ